MAPFLSSMPTSMVSMQLLGLTTTHSPYVRLLEEKRVSKRHA